MKEKFVHCNKIMSISINTIKILKMLLIKIINNSFRKTFKTSIILKQAQNNRNKTIHKLNLTQKEATQI